MLSSYAGTGTRWAKRAGIGSMVVLMLLASTAAAEEARTRKTVETVVTFDWDSVPVVGAVLGSQTVGGRGLRDGCPPVVVTYTEPELFEGGSYILQQGFAEQEIAAASFSIPAGDFPLKFSKAEMVFAQSQWNNTVTQWSLLIFDGPPDTGILAGTFSSDDTILPHLRLPTGDPLSRGANLQVTIDPGDPEQIIIYNNSGTSTVTIGYRIDVHNNQTADPCWTPPPANENAFPTVDNSGLVAPANNWLYGVDCGILGCPANGGWASFAALPGYCTPSGDWIIRLTYEPLNCDPTGACCETGTRQCRIETEGDCLAAGDIYKGNGTSCTPDNPCEGACCNGTGGCLDHEWESHCQLLGGIYAGDGTFCSDGVCALGACCLPDGSCQDVVTPECDGIGGEFHSGTNCATYDCPDPIGACCIGAVCSPDQTEANCVGFGGEWAGAQTACPAVDADLCPLCDDGDMDADLDVDLQDFAEFQMCFDITYAQACKCADLDNDFDVDLDDYAAFESALVGP